MNSAIFMEVWVSREWKREKEHSQATLVLNLLSSHAFTIKNEAKQNDVMFPGFNHGHMPNKASDVDTTITVNDATVVL